MKSSIKKQLKIILVNNKITRPLIIKFLNRETNAIEYHGMTLYSYAVRNSDLLYKHRNFHFNKVRVTHKLLLGGNIPERETGYVIDYYQYAAVISDALLVSESESVITGNYYLNDRIFNYPECSVDFSASPSNFITSNRSHDVVVAVPPKISRTLDKGINMVGRWPSHIWHLSLEILTRLKWIEKHTEFDGWPLIFDEAVFDDSRNKELIDLFNIKHYPIVILPRGENWRVKQLACGSFNIPEEQGYYDVPEITSPKKKTSNIFLMPDIETIDLLRKRVKRTGHHTGKRMFIKRRDKRLDNEDEVAEYFLRLGFELYDPEKLTFEQEVKSFEEAEFVVGTVGGAFTNCIYCNAGAKICMIAIPNQTDVLLFPEMASHYGFQVFTLEADVMSGGEQVPGTILHMPLDRCDEAIKALGLR